MSFTFRHYLASDFTDLMTLFKSEPVPADCRCLSHRVEPKDLELGALAENKMRRFSDQRRVHGALAYFGDLLVGWAGIEPAPELIGHDVFEELIHSELDFKMADTDWAIHCIFVHPDYRKQIDIQALVQNAEDYAMKRGAQRLIAFATADERYIKLPCYQKNSGSCRLFEALGFKNLGLLAQSYQLMLKPVTQKRSGLQLVRST